MSDLISRQAAIDAILKLTNCASVREQYEYTQAHQLADMWNGGIVDAIDAVIGVKSSHCDNCPYHSQYVPQEGAVSRKAMLQMLTSIKYTHCGTDGQADVIDTAKIMVNVMPSVQPDGTDTNVGGMISRQAAIDAIENAFDRETILNRFVRKIAISAVRLLPSAQPETAKRIVGKSRDGMTLWYQCDMCNEPVDAQDNFCRGCGRRLIDERSNRQTGSD